MNAIGTNLKDAYLITNQVFEDDRGSFTESFNLKEIEKITGHSDFIQDNHSISEKGVLRGLHYQIKHPQGKLVRCIFGEIYDVIVDLRQSSPTFGNWIGIKLYPGSPQLWVPPGFAHGFYVLSDKAEVLYKVTDYRYAEHERTLLWNDQTLAINWNNDTNPIMSDKDILGKSFADCEKYD